MKKFISVILVLTMVLSMAACGKKAQETAPAAQSVAGTMEELLNKTIEQRPVEFMGGVIPVDLTDSSEDGLWALKNYTGLDSAEKISEAAAFEPMMGSLAFSMVMVRLADGADAKSVAESMKSGIDTRKWICVEANDLKVAGFGDVVMLIMVNSDSGMTAQSFVDAFAKVAGFEPEFVI